MSKSATAWRDDGTISEANQVNVIFFWRQGRRVGRTQLTDGRQHETGGTCPESRRGRPDEHPFFQRYRFTYILPLLHSFKKEKSIMFNLVQQPQESRWVLLEEVTGQANQVLINHVISHHPTPIQVKCSGVFVDPNPSGSRGHTVTPMLPRNEHVIRNAPSEHSRQYLQNIISPKPSRTKTKLSTV